MLNRNIIAAAAFAAASTASLAQSTVTVYGVLDQGVIKGNGGTATSQGALGTSKAWNLGQATTSRLGFRGTEDLGGGLSAQFQIEHRLNPDTGAQNSSTALWNGRSYVQLSSKDLGAVYLGREYTPGWHVQVKSDPFGNDGVGQAGPVALWGNYQTPDAQGNGTRSSNTVGYKSPKLLGGLTVNAAVALSESTGLGRVQGFNAEYAQGPLYLGLSFEQVKNGSANKQGVTSFAAHYDLGMVKPIFYYAQGKTGTNGSVEASTWMLGATAPLAGGTVKFMYYDLDSDVNSNDRSKFGLGYNYPLSKRTNLYADFGQAKQTGRTNNSAYALGVKHVF